MILTLGLLAMLWINTTLAQGAFTLTDLQQQRAQLLETEQQLAEQLARAESPAQVEAAARELGMVPQEVPVFVRLTDGQIIGEPIPQPEPAPVEDAVETPIVEGDVPPLDVTDAGDVSTDGSTSTDGNTSGVDEPVVDETIADETTAVTP